MRFSTHARQRMRERDISEAEVREVVAGAAVSWPGHEAGTRVYRHTVGSRTLKVVVAHRDGGRDVIVTVAEVDG